jgi:hypothetical protein
MTLESTVAQKNKNRTKKTPKVKEDELPVDFNKPWASLRSGMIIMTITSLALAVLIAWQVIPNNGWLAGIGWGLLFGALIWAIFFGNLWISKKLRK